MGVEFLPICDVLFNVVSLASYFCDVVFDIIATYTFFVSGHTPWFWISLISITSSLITCQILSAKWMMKQERYRNMSRRKFLILTTVHCLGGGMIWRYSLLFAPIQLDHVKQEMRNLCVLRMIHGFAGNYSKIDEKYLTQFSLVRIHDTPPDTNSHCLCDQRFCPGNQCHLYGLVTL